MSDIRLIERRVSGTTDDCRDTPGAIVAEPGASLSRERPDGRCSRADVDDTASRVAVEGGRCAANCFDPPHRLEIQVVDRSLTIRQRQGHAVAQNLDAAHAE